MIRRQLLDSSLQIPADEFLRLFDDSASPRVRRRELGIWRPGGWKSWVESVIGWAKQAVSRSA
jgi:hypothetical protein